MNVLRTDHVRDARPWSGLMSRGQILRIEARSIVSLVCFNADDVNERFDQARTKVYNMALWAGTGSILYSKLNNPMMTILADGFDGSGRHDLQLGFGSAARLAGAPHTPDARLALAQALAPWEIPAAVVPSPLNLFSLVEIDTASGALRPLPLRPAEPTGVELKAEMNLIVAAIQAPDPAHASPSAFDVAILAE